MNKYESSATTRKKSPRKASIYERAKSEGQQIKSCIFRACGAEVDVIDAAAALTKRTRQDFMLHAVLIAANKLVPEEQRVKIAA